MADVVIYTRAMCGFCSRAKRLLDEKGVPYDEIDTTFSREKRMEMAERAGGRRTVPQIFIGGTHVGGCDELYMLERAGELEHLLQPA